jgi:phosphodiesterase/alkaline phosphatase D-like protein
VNPNGTATTYVFEYGPSLSFGSLTAQTSAGSGTADVTVSASLTGLSPRTTYYYRLVAKPSETRGAVMSFTTGGSTVAPLAVTGPPRAVGNTTATLAGQVNPEGQATAFTFEYGTTTSFGNISTLDETDAAGTLEPVVVPLSGLAADTTYFYRLVATNGAGTAFGSVSSFTTGPGGAPIVTTGAASGLTSTAATLAGTVNPHGEATTFAFEYGTTTSFGSLSAVDNAGSTDASEPVTLAIAGLQSGRTYLYRLVATNATGTTAAAVMSFTTP